MSQVTAVKSLWRLFPYAIVGALGVVIAVNITMAVLAHRSAPGLAVQGSFATSNAYGAIQAEARRQVGLGWSLDVGHAEGRLVVGLAGQGGAVLPGAALRASASRPVGDEPAIELGMVGDAAGRFRSDVVLPGRGQWDVLFVASHDGRTFRHTRRIVIP
jgi:nitrogen fixation protein FixH